MKNRALALIAEQVIKARRRKRLRGEPLAKGGLVDTDTETLVGEGRNPYPGFVIPTDPEYRDRLRKK